MSITTTSSVVIKGERFEIELGPWFEAAGTFRKVSIGGTEVGEIKRISNHEFGAYTETGDFIGRASYEQGPHSAAYLIVREA